MEMCFDIGSRHLVCWGQNTSRIHNKEGCATFSLQANDTLREYVAFEYSARQEDVEDTMAAVALLEQTWTSARHNATTTGDAYVIVAMPLVTTPVVTLLFKPAQDTTQPRQAMRTSYPGNHTICGIPGLLLQLHRTCTSTCTPVFPRQDRSTLL